MRSDYTPSKSLKRWQKQLVIKYRNFEIIIDTNRGAKICTININNCTLILCATPAQAIKFAIRYNSSHGIPLQKNADLFTLPERY